MDGFLGWGVGRKRCFFGKLMERSRADLYLPFEVIINENVGLRDKLLSYVKAKLVGQMYVLW